MKSILLFVAICFCCVPKNPAKENQKTIKLCSSYEESFVNLNDLQSDLSDSNDFDIANYDFDSQTLSFECFNPDSYYKRISILDYQNRFLNENEKEIDSDFLVGFSAVENKILSYNPNENIVRQVNGGEGIYGEDDRTRILTPSVFPFLPTSFIEIKHDNNISFVGSGYVAGPNLVVTNAHIAYGIVSSLGNEPRFPEEISIYPGLNGSNELPDYSLKCNAKVVHFPKKYYEFNENIRSQNDWAIIEVDRNIGFLTGWYGSSCNWFEYDHEVYSYGYPADKSCQMWQTVGRTLGIVNNDAYLATTMDIVGGQSGSPVLATFDDNNDYVVGLATGSTFLSTETLYTNVTRYRDFAFHFLRSFFNNRNVYTELASIVPTDYNYPDSYPTSASISENYITHNLNNGFSFKTRRYRTGYIHNELIVMSPIRKNIYDAFIEYFFDCDIYKIEIELSYWRDPEIELLNKSNGVAKLQVLYGNTWVDKLDLLSDETNLPIDRTIPEMYSIELTNPISKFRLYAHCNQSFNIDYNRGRICIGNINLYSYEF